MMQKLEIYLVLNKNEREKIDSRGILHSASTTILSGFLANKNKINSLFNVLNVIFFFTKNSFSLLLFKIHKKKVTKMVNTLSFYRFKTIFDRSKFF